MTVTDATRLAQRLVWTAAALMTALAVAFAVTWMAASRAPEARRPADTRTWECVWPEDPSYVDLPEDFDFSARVRLAGRAGVSGSAIRFLIAPGDATPSGTPAHAAFVELAVGAASSERQSGGVRATVGRIEAGAVFVRGARNLPLRPSEWHELAVQRRGVELAVIVDGLLAACMVEPHFVGGRIALAETGGAGAEPRPVARMPEAPCFTDDFMRTREDPSPWTVVKGHWSLQTIDTPSLSANAFSCRGRGEAALATVGGSSWGQYMVQVAARGEPGEAMGLAFAVRRPAADGPSADGQKGVAPARYALLRWTARDRGAEPPRRGVREFVIAETAPDGSPVEHVLASEPGGYTPGQWYRLTAELDYGRARVLIDEHEVFRIADLRLAAGGVGLWSAGGKGAAFDDAVVSPHQTVDDDFAPESADWPERWEAVGPDKLVTGAPWWRRLAAEATVDLGAVREGGSTGLVVNYRDEMDHVRVRLAPAFGKCVLERVHEGGVAVLDEARLVASSLAGETSLRIESCDGYLAGYVDGARVVEGWDETSVEGRAGLFSEGWPRATTAPAAQGAGLSAMPDLSATAQAGGRQADMATRSARAAGFGRFRAEFLPQQTPVLPPSPVVVQDTLMAAWAGEGADWYRSKESSPGANIYWHRALFEGDVDLALDLPQPYPGEGRIVLGVAKSPEKPSNGYGLVFEASSDAGPPRPPEGQPGEAERAASGYHCRLWREGKTVGATSFDSGHATESVSIRRRGSYVFGCVNGEARLAWRDPEPLDGKRVAFMADGIDIEPASARLYGGRVFDYRFERAPVDWRLAAGRCGITNRWVCDDTWSFFSVSYDPDGPTPAAVVWNKRSFSGDMVIDFFVGPMMEEPARGRRYEYMRDINVTIAADGRDVKSGYTFTFGGFRNTRSAILRGATVLVEVADASARIPTSMIIHQNWYRIHVEREGHRLSYRVSLKDNPVLSLDCEDPDPLDGDRMAIWAYDCGVMVARLRIAADSVGEPESPDFEAPEVPKTMYDVAPDAASGQENR